MAGSPKEGETQYVLKKGGNEVQIVACKGWIDPCEYCDKRFCSWVTVDEDIYEKIPEKPGFFMIGLKNKNTTEVVSILFHTSNIQNPAVEEIGLIKDQISNKKSKATNTKSVMVVRWMIVKNLKDKENSVLCAHWQNNGLLPKFLKVWPGNNLLEESDDVEFSKQTQKWCYPQKNPVWRKAKPVSSKKLEVVEKCTLASCKTCDSYLTPWKSLTDVIEKDLAPKEGGLVMLSVAYGKNRDIILISSDAKNVTVPVKATIKNYENSEKYYLKNAKYENKNANLEVRWVVINDVDSDNSCFLYAHWLNADTYPEYNASYSPPPGENALNKNKHFVYRINDKKWFYEIEVFKQTKFSKTKNRRQIFEEMADQEDDSDE